MYTDYIREKSPRGKLIKFIRGSKDKSIFERLRSKPRYGQGQDKKEGFWTDLIRAMLAKGYLGENTKRTKGVKFSYSVIAILHPGRTWLQQYRFNRKATLELETTENLVLNSNTGQNQRMDTVVDVKPSPSAEQTILPSVPTFDRVWLNKFMQGPYLDDGVIEKSESVKKLERNLSKQLRESRASISVIIFIY